MIALLQRGSSCTRRVINDHRNFAAIVHLLLQQSVRGLPMTRRLPENERLSVCPGVTASFCLSCSDLLLSITIYKEVAWKEIFDTSRERRGFYSGP